MGKDKMLDCCKVDALVSVDERGQMVLPKEIRDKTGIKAGDKLAVVSFQGKNCCLVLMKAKDLEETVKGILGPLIEKIIKK
jgi:AbrB family looped-hinge helix DNA binding protein